MNDDFGSDERWASWKVLLPLETGSRVLVLGGWIGLVTALARSGMVIDWLSADGIAAWSELADGCKNSIFLLESENSIIYDYDVVVVADTKQPSSFLREIVAHRLKSSGFLVQVALDNPPWRADDILNLGFDNWVFLSSLPPANPRLFFPLSPKEFARSALSFHLPGSWKAFVTLQLLKLVLDIRFTLPLRQRGVVVCSRRKASGCRYGLRAWLSRKLSRRVENLAVYCGSQSQRRKMTLLLGCDDAELLVAKVADTDAGAEAINQECEALRLLERSEVGCCFPRLLFRGSWGRHLVQVQEAFSTEFSRVKGEIRKEHLEALASFARISRKEIQLSGTREWLEAFRVLENRASDLPVPLSGLWRKILLDSNEKNAMVPVHLVHGDFTPWNMRLRGDGRLAVFDWEDSLPDGLAYRDLFRYIYRYLSLVGPWPGGEKVYRLFNEKAGILCSMVHDFDRSLSGRVAPLLILTEYLEQPHSHLVELAEALLRGENG